MAEGSVTWPVRFLAVLFLQLTFVYLCLTFDLEGSQTSYAKFSKWEPCLNGSLRFEFKTNQPNGLLLYMDDGGRYDFFEVKLVGGIVRLRLNLGEGTVIFTAGHELSDMHWHKVEIRRKKERTTLSVDSTSQSRKSKGKEFTFGGINNSYVFFGGMPLEYSAKMSTLALPSIMFEPTLKGAIRNIFFSNCGGPAESPTMIDFQGIRNSKEDLCEQSNPCENGGICLSMDNGILCDCSRTDYEGKHCERAKVPSEATFFGAHYLTYDLSSRGDPIVSNNDEISLYFRTRQANGLLFYTGDGADYLNIALKNGGIAVSVNLGSGAYSTVVQPPLHRFDDNQWHHLEVRREARELTRNRGVCYILIRVDGKEQDYGSTSGDFTLLSSNLLYVAGSPNTPQLSGSLVSVNFKGCLRKVLYKADSIHLDLVGLAQTRNSLVKVIGDVLFNKCQDLVESQPVTFTSPESFLTLPRWEPDKNGTIAFQFQTIEENGVIMYNNGAHTHSDFFALEILDGDLYMILDLGSGPVKVKAPGRSLVSDGLLHSILVNLDGQKGFVKLDGLTIDFATPGVDEKLDLDGKLYVGGISDDKDAYLLPQEMWSGMLGYGFVGCLQDLVINGQKVDMALLAKKQSAQGIAEYCRTMESQCLSRPCMHKGLCNEGWNRFICDCRATGYIGPVCQEAATTLKFDGTQHMKISLPEESLTEAEDISLRFMTIYPNGLLFLTTTGKSEDRMELIIETGSVHFNLNLGGATTSLVVGSGVNDGYWHTVYIKRRARELQVSIDDQRPRRDKLISEGYTFVCNQIILGSVQPHIDVMAKSRSRTTTLAFESLELGNVLLRDDNSLRAPTSFNGEMQQFVFNKNPFIELAGSGQILNIELTATIGSQEIHKDPVTFKAKSAYVVLPQFRAYSAFTMYFQLKTTEADGLVFYNAGKEQDFIAVELSDGFLYYSYSVGAGSSRVKIDSNGKLNDNEWHDMSIVRPDHTQHILRVDNVPPTIHKSRETEIVHFDLSGPFYVGGVKKSMYSLLPRSIRSRDGYQGCMASLDFNSEMPNLVSNRDKIVGSVAEGCRGPSVECDSDSCMNEGRCVQQWNSFSCDCDLTSYTGPRCTEESISYRFGSQPGIITYNFPYGKYAKTTYDELALGFVTRENDSVLVRIDSGTSDDYIEMELVQGNVFVVYNMGTEDHPVGELFQKVSDGKYHVVKFTRTGPNSTIQVDDMLVQPKFPHGRQLSMFNDQAVIQIGGKREENGRIGRPFRGIMSGLVFNGKRLLDLAAQNDAQISMEGAVVLDMGTDKPQPEEVKPDPLEDLVKAGWQSTEGLRNVEAAISTPASVPTSLPNGGGHNENLNLGSGSECGNYPKSAGEEGNSGPVKPGFEDVESEHDYSGSGSGSGVGDPESRYHPPGLTSWSTDPTTPHLTGREQMYISTTVSSEGNRSVRFTTTSSTELNTQKETTTFSTSISSTPNTRGDNTDHVSGSGSGMGTGTDRTVSADITAVNSGKQSGFEDMEFDWEDGEELTERSQSGSGSGFTGSIQQSSTSYTRNRESSLTKGDHFEPPPNIIDVYLSKESASKSKDKTFHGRDRKRVNKVDVKWDDIRIPFRGENKTSNWGKTVINKRKHYRVPILDNSSIDKTVTIFVNPRKTSEMEKAFTWSKSGGRNSETGHGSKQRKHTTPKQDVTDEIIFAGEGSGCHSDDEDDCTDIVSGHEDDIITPTVIIRTTPKPDPTTSKHSLCDDEDSCDGSGNDGKVTTTARKPHTKKPKPTRKNTKTTSTKGSATKGSTRSTARPSSDITGPNLVANMTLAPNGQSPIGPGNGNGPTDSPIKTENTDDLNLGLIIGIVAGVVVALIILIYALYKFRSRDEGSYKVDETQNFAYISEPKKAPSNGGLKPNNNCNSGTGKTGKKRDVKEWYV